MCGARHGVASATDQTCSLRLSNVLEIRYPQVSPTFADDRSRRLAAVKGRLSSRAGARSARRSSCLCSGSLPCGWRLPDRPPCRAVQYYRVRRARPPKVIVFAAAAVGVARVSGFDTTGARWCPSIVQGWAACSVRFWSGNACTDLARCTRLALSVDLKDPERSAREPRAIP